MKQNNPKISIIIPVYGVEQYLEACLNSVTKQDYTGEIECLLIDDCGPDRSMDVANNSISKYNGAIDFRVFHHNHNRGLSAARNTGLQNSTGDYIYFLDSDDEITTDCISVLVGLIQNDTPDVCIANFNVIGAEEDVDVNLQYSDGDIIEGVNIIRDYVKYKFPMMACNKLYNHEFLKKNKLKFKEGLINEDELWTFEIASLATNMVISTKQTYLYIKRPNSITTAKPDLEKKTSSFLNIVYSMRQFVVEYNLMDVPQIASKIDSVAFLTLVMSKKCEPSLVESTYKQLLNGDIYNSIQRIRISVQTPKDLLRSGIYLLPYSLGLILFKIILKKY